MLLKKWKFKKKPPEKEVFVKWELLIFSFLDSRFLSTQFTEVENA